jgi:predicted acyltransferase
MIIVNTPGSGEHVWWPLDHAAWHGFTPTDLVFPAFLFAVGVALGLSFPRRIDTATWTRILRRTLLLIALGWMIQLLARLSIENFRFFGVLPRIGLCYALAAGLAILTAKRIDARAHLDPRAIIAAAIAALAVYAALLLLVPVPGHGAGQLTPEGNIAGYIDRTLFTTAHIWRFGTDAAGNIVYDPEGLLSTLPALANVLFGILAAVAWKRAPETSVRWLVLVGIALALIGLALTPILPLNKRIWTPSFALFTTGLSAILLALAMLATARAPLRKLLTPFHIFGMNAITGYILSLLIAIAALKPILPGGATVQAWTFARINAVVPDPYLASFLYAVLILLIVFAALVPMHRRGIHLRL